MRRSSVSRAISRPDRIKGRDQDGLGRVIDDQVDSRRYFQGANIPPLPPDDAAFHFIVGQIDHRHRRFRHVVGRIALDGQDDDLGRLLTGVLSAFL